ncbi:transcriptional regulator, LacI family [Paenibacillus sp. OV219]|nr:transcriptional regulator, LacI family [Paenibacillus sp. OV219]
MSGIKEIAELAQVSEATTSLVLNGKGDASRISSATQQKVFEAAKTLNYRPNISARRLRNGGEKVLPVIALLWTLDSRASLVGPFLKGIQTTISNYNEEFDLMIQPFLGSQLSEIRSLITGTRFNGAIIVNPTEQDEQFLEAANPSIPIVLYQRSSQKYSCVNVDNFKSGQEVATLFANRGHREVGIVLPNVSSTAIRKRKEGFLTMADELGLHVRLENIIFNDFNETGGYNAFQKLMQSSILPSAVFVASDQMSVGALSALNEQGIQVPHDIEIVSHDNYEVSKFTIPPLTTMHIPLDEMATACVQILVDLMHHQVTAPIHKNFETHLVVRETCGGFK